MRTSFDEALAARPAHGRRIGSIKTLGGVLRWLTESYRVRRLEHELYELDERMLRDIGLTRTEIPHLARHGRTERLSRTSV